MRYSTHVLKTCLLSGCLLGVAGCGAGSPGGVFIQPPPPTPEFVYATATNDNTVVAGFSLDPMTGALSSLGSTPGPDQGVPVADPTGNYLYVSDTYFNDQVYVYSIDPATGVLSDLPGSPFVFAPSASSSALYGVAIDPLGKFIYYSVFSPIGIGGAEINGSTGSLLGNSYVFVPATIQIEETAFAPSGSFLFAANAADSFGSDYLVFSVDPNSGALTQVPGSPFTVDPNSEPLSVAVHPSGSFLYSALNNSLSAQTSGIAAMTIDSGTGALALVAGSPFSAGTGFQHLVVHKSGKFLYAVTTAADNVYGFAIDQGSGALTPLSDPFPTGAAPISLEFDATGQFLLVGNFVDSTISVFRMDSTSGALSQIAGSPFPAGLHVGYLTVAQAH